MNSNYPPVGLLIPEYFDAVSFPGHISGIERASELGTGQSLYGRNPTGFSSVVSVTR